MTRRLSLVALLGVVLGRAALAAPAPAKVDAAAAPAKAAEQSATKAGAPASPEAAGEETYAVLRAPLFSDDFASTPVASVEGELVTLRDLTGALAGVHGGHGEGQKAGKKDFTPVLDRLVDVRLIVLEAREMGLDELPEFKKARDRFRVDAEQEILKEKVTEGAKADPAEVDRLYKDAVREWKVASVLLDRADYGKELTALVKSGKTFEAAAAQLVAEKKGKDGGPADFLPRDKMLGHVVDVLTGLKVGEISPPVKVQEGFAVMKILDVRYPDVPATRAKAEGLALVNKKKAILTDYYVEAVKRHAKLDRHLLDRLDFAAKKPGLAALAKDKRVIARVQGAKAITVGDLAEELEGSFYHGAEGAMKGDRINRQKYEVFDGLLAQRILPLEVKRRHLDESPELARRMKDWETSALFSQVVQRVILPDLKAGEPEQRKYYDAHLAEFATPAMYRLESLVFRSAKEAQAAVDSLRSGTDFKWLNANAEGQVGAGERRLRLDGVVAATTLAPDVAKALAGTKAGDLRLYQEPETSFYHAVRVVDVVPAGHQAFEEVRPMVQQKVVGEAVGEGIRAYAAKLRKVRDVKVYLTRIGG